MSLAWECECSYCGQLVCQCKKDPPESDDPPGGHIRLDYNKLIVWVLAILFCCSVWACIAVLVIK